MTQLRRIGFLRVEAERKVVLLGSRIDRVAIMLHVGKNGSTPCHGKRCRACDESPARIYGFCPGGTPVYCVDDRQWHMMPVIVGLTEACAPLVFDERENLYVRLWRQPKKPNGRMCYELIENSTPPCGIIPPFDVVPHLVRRFGIGVDTEREQCHNDHATPETASAPRDAFLP